MTNLDAIIIEIPGDRLASVEEIEEVSDNRLW